MNHSETIAKVSAALVAAQAEISLVPFDSVNPFLKNRYATLGAVIEIAKPVLAKHGLAVLQPVIGEGDQMGVETTILHTSGEWLSSTVTLAVENEKGRSRAQSAGAIITYLRRYGLASILSLYADEDTDALPTHQGTNDMHDFDYGSVPEVPVAPPAKPKAQKANGKQRPLAPETLLDMMTRKVATYAGQVASRDQLGLAMGMLNECFAGEEDSDQRRHSVLMYLFGVESGNALHGERVLALLDWLKPERDDGGAYAPDAMAVREAWAVWREHMINSGQAEMFDSGEAGSVEP